MPKKSDIEIIPTRVPARPSLLEGAVKSYDWGQSGPEAFLPSWLGADPASRPFWAELWFGGHPGGPSILSGEGTDLAARIARDPAAALGPSVARRFGGVLPFLVKLLAVGRPLSIQAHPGVARAERGFAREEAAGVPLSDPRRTYKDPRPKPEALIALTTFRALKGFRDPADVAVKAGDHPELSFLTSGSLKDRFTAALTMAPEAADRALSAVAARLRARNAREPFGPDRPEHWFLRAEETFCPGPRKDAGLFSFFLLDLVRLDPGDAFFVAPGEAHAYLQGTAVEVMGNSDNVLRGGLTSKFVDREGLLDVLRFEPSVGKVIKPEAGVYRTPAEEFEASVAEWGNAGGSDFSVDGGPALWVPLEGAAEWRSGGEVRPLRPGRALFVPAGTAGRITGEGKGKAILVRTPGAAR
jgi:mannose-6-phosphate isomerase